MERFHTEDRHSEVTAARTIQGFLETLGVAESLVIEDLIAGHRFEFAADRRGFIFVTVPTGPKGLTPEGMAARHRISDLVESLLAEYPSEPRHWSVTILDSAGRVRYASHAQESEAAETDGVAQRGNVPLAEQVRLYLMQHLDSASGVPLVPAQQFGVTFGKRSVVITAHAARQLVEVSCQQESPLPDDLWEAYSQWRPTGIARLHHAHGATTAYAFIPARPFIGQHLLAAIDAVINFDYDRAADHAPNEY